MVDNISFSRSKKNISRDFSDGVMMAEVIHHYKPKSVALHNYPAANSFSKKVNNWNTLNNKVLKKMGLSISKSHIDDIVNCVPLAIETFLHQVFVKFEYPEQEANMVVERETRN